MSSAEPHGGKHRVAVLGHIGDGPVFGVLARSFPPPVRLWKVTINCTLMRMTVGSVTIWKNISWGNSGGINDRPISREIPFGGNLGPFFLALIMEYHS